MLKVRSNAKEKFKGVSPKRENAGKGR